MTTLDRIDRAPQNGTPPRRVVHVQGPMTADDVADAEAVLAQGSSVLVVLEPDDEIAAAFCGVRVISDLPRTEWFVTLADRPEAVRLSGEVSITTPLRTLQPTHPDTQVAATTSVRFEHLPTVTVRTVGSGRIVTVGAADLGALNSHEVLGRYVARLLRPGRRPRRRAEVDLISGVCSAWRRIAKETVWVPGRRTSRTRARTRTVPRARGSTTWATR